MLRRRAQQALHEALRCSGATPGGGYVEPLTHLASPSPQHVPSQAARASICSQTSRQEGGRGEGGSSFGCGSFAAGMLLAASSPIMAAQAEQGSGSSIPVSETATHPLDDEAVTNEHTAKMSMARIAALEYYQAGKYELAEKKFKEAIEEAILGFNPQDPHVASAKNNLAEFYRNLGQHPKAEVLYLECLSILEGAFGEKHWLYVSAMHNLALSYEAIGNLEAAKQTMEDVMRLRKEMFGPRHFLYADTLFALGNIELKQAERAKSSQQQQGSGNQAQQGEGQAKKGGWRVSWKGWRRGKGSQQSQEQEALNMMQDAVDILESAESVQTNVVVLWLEKLASEFKDRGRTQDAANCMRKAMHHFGAGKGEGLAQASQLSDSLVELLLLMGDLEGARDVIADSVAARTQLFGRQLVVCQSMLRLANLEVKLGKKGNMQAALQHATNASNLAGELMEEYAKQVDSWKGRLTAKNADLALKRVRAAHVHAIAHKFLADHSSQEASQQQHLRSAIAALKPASASAAKYMNDLSAGQGSQGKAHSEMESLADLYVDTLLLMLDCVDRLGSKAVDAEEKSRLSRLSEDVLRELGVQ